MEEQSKPGQPSSRIVLVGMMGSGKTTVGRLLAQRLGVPYVDNDEVLAAQTGMSPAEILDTSGVERLRAAEAAALAAALGRDAVAVVGVAAGAILDPENRARMRAGGRVVWLRGRPETLIRRLTQAPSSGDRPTFADDMASWIRAHAEARAELYAEVARDVVDVDERTPEAVADTILAGHVEPVLPGRFRAVVFDLDGVLVETETIWREAKVRLFRAHGVEFTAQDHHAVLGTSEEYTARTFLGRFGLDDAHLPTIVEEYLGTASAIFSAGVETREGATQIIGALRGRVPLGLASNTRRQLVDLILERAGLAGCFDAIVTGDEARPKPEPDLYLRACAKLGVAPRDAVAIEDSPTGVRAARAAGMTCIGIPSDSGVDLTGANVVVRSLLDLVEA
jgi:HAD superfamily hydrolase (TIGR01509 family)